MHGGDIRFELRHVLHERLPTKSGISRPESVADSWRYPVPVSHRGGRVLVFRRTARSFRPLLVLVGRGGRTGADWEHGAGDRSCRPARNLGGAPSAAGDV